MPLCLVLHDLPAGGTEVLEAAIWEVSESHWTPMANALLVSSDLSVDYISSHRTRALRREHVNGTVLAMRADSREVAEGVAPEAVSWLHERAGLEPAGTAID